VTTATITSTRTSVALAGARTFVTLSLDYQQAAPSVSVPIQEEGGTGSILGEGGEEIYEE
jgi:hypothetical protein